MRAYGNWCGPGWSAGQYKDAKDLTFQDKLVPAVDALDEICKEHDILLQEFPQMTEIINGRFMRKARNMGITGKLFALAVEKFGPSGTSLYNLPWRGEI
jgi:hypothetical protein